MYAGRSVPAASGSSLHLPSSAMAWLVTSETIGAKITRKIREAGSAATAVIARSKAADLATVIADELRNSAQRRCAGRLRLRKGVV
jgi:hypothetical protein